MTAGKTRCRQCGRRYEALASHWARSADCGYPDPTPTQWAVLDGIMIAGGGITNRLRVEDDPGVNPYLSVAHFRERAVEWLAAPDQLGDQIVATIDTADPGERSPDAYETAKDTGKLYILRTRSLPALRRYLDWYGPGGERMVPEHDVEPSPKLRQTMFALRGRDATDRPGAYLSLRKTGPSESLLARLFRGYDVSLNTGGDSHMLRVRGNIDSLDPLNER